MVETNKDVIYPLVYLLCVGLWGFESLKSDRECDCVWACGVSGLDL